MAECGAGQFIDSTLVVLYRELISVVFRFNNLSIQFAEQVFRADNIAQMFQRPLFYNRLEIWIRKRLLICKAVVFKDLSHIHLCALGKITVENSAKNIVAELIGVHAASQIVCDGPEL